MSWTKQYHPLTECPGHYGRETRISFRGLRARLYTKLTAHTLCIHINRLLGKLDFL
jgi:hypothetical protein